MHSLTQATALAVTLLSAVVSAQNNLDVAKEAYRNPNDTRSIRFKPYPDTPHLADLEWTWRVNISDSRSNPQSNRSTSFTVRASYDFTYHNVPLNATLDDALPQLNNLSFCQTWYVPSNRGWPANLTNLYTDAHTNSTSCAPVLGEDCVDAIIRSMGSNNGAPGFACTTPGGSWEKLPECASSLGYLHDWQGGQTTMGTSKLNGANSGEAFASLTSLDYEDVSNKTIYENYLNAVHMVLLNAPTGLITGNDTSGGFATREPKRMMCMRVGTAQREVDDDEGGNGGGGDSDGNGGDGGDQGGNGGDGGSAAFHEVVNWWALASGMTLAAFMGIAL